MKKTEKFTARIFNTNCFEITETLYQGLHILITKF